VFFSSQVNLIIAIDINLAIQPVYQGRPRRSKPHTMTSDEQDRSASDYDVEEQYDATDDQYQDDHAAYTEQYRREEQQHNDDAYPEGGDGKPPTRGGKEEKEGGKEDDPAPEKPAVNNP
jgi:hypothetical protein